MSLIALTNIHFFPDLGLLSIHQPCHREFVGDLALSGVNDLLENKLGERKSEIEHPVTQSFTSVNGINPNGWLLIWFA